MKRTFLIKLRIHGRIEEYRIDSCYIDHAKDVALEQARQQFPLAKIRFVSAEFVEFVNY